MNISLFKTVTLCCGLALVSACAEPAVRDTQGFTLTQQGEEMSGTYDPAGFTELTIKDLIKFDCPTQRLASYSETAGPRTLVTFTATCAA